MKTAGVPAARARAGIVLAHGRGGTPGDILGLMAHAALPDVAAIAPGAPDGSWWPSSFLAPTAAMEPFVVAAIADMQAALAELEAEGLPRGRIWLAGFSQGACLALETFARVGEGLAGVIGMSGGLVGTADAEGLADVALYGFGPKRFDYPGSRAGARVYLGAHERDPHIPLRRFEETAEVLRGMGADVQAQLYPGAGHGVMRDDIAALRRFLNAD